MGSQADELLQDASRLLGCATVSIRCECANLETVYLDRDDGQLMLTDRGETYGYLDQDDDDTYRPLGEKRGRAICQRHGVELDASDPESRPRILRKLTESEDLPRAVSAVAAAIDEVFRAANRFED